MRLDPFPRFPADKAFWERKLTDLFRDTAKQVNDLRGPHQRGDQRSVQRAHHRHLGGGRFRAPQRPGGSGFGGSQVRRHRLAALDLGL